MLKAHFTDEQQALIHVFHSGSVGKEAGDGGEEEADQDMTRHLSSDTAAPVSESRASVLSEKDAKTISDLQEKVTEMEKKMSFVEDLVPDEKKVCCFC